MPVHIIMKLDRFQLYRCLEMGFDEWYTWAQWNIKCIKEVFLGAMWMRDRKIAKTSLSLLKKVWPELFTSKQLKWLLKAQRVLDFSLKHSLLCVRYARIPISQDSRLSLQYRDWRFNCLERDSWKCRDCGSKKKLHVHHIKSFKDHPQFRIDINNGTTLCRPCHTVRHRKG